MNDNQSGTLAALVVRSSELLNDVSNTRKSGKLEIACNEVHGRYRLWLGDIGFLDTGWSSRFLRTLTCHGMHEGALNADETTPQRTNFRTQT